MALVAVSGAGLHAVRRGACGLHEARGATAHPSYARPALESQPGPKLHVTRRLVAVRRTEVCTLVIVVTVYTVQIDPVEQVEHIQSKLDLEAFGDGGALFHGEIHIGVPGVAEYVR